MATTLLGEEQEIMTLVQLNENMVPTCMTRILASSSKGACALTLMLIPYA
jgi:hypothetical protein